MPRAIWSGAISFGLVNIPVKLYSAVSRKTVRFHQLDGSDHARVRQRRVNERTGEEVPYENVVKGYETAPDTYVVVTPDELDAVEPKKTRMIEIEDFVDLEGIDPIFYDHPYYLLPTTGAEKAYSLLVKAMEDSGKVAIARVVLRSKENLVAIRPKDRILTMETMLFADEVMEPDNFDESEGAQAKTTKREVEMAMQLIDSLTSAFDPSKYRDEYRDRVLELIERKAQGEEVVLEAPAQEPEKVPDLMSALEASISQSKKQSSGGSKKKKPASRSKSSSNGSGSRSSGSKRKTAKKS